jgi:hypothetical protein
MIAIITANTNNFEKGVTHIEQTIPVTFYKFTDENFPPRYNAITPRLQSKIPKMFGWQMVPEHDYYIWIDSSFSLDNPDTVKWALKQCEGVDAAFLKHPVRNTIKEENAFVMERIQTAIQKNALHRYTYTRYNNEFFDDQTREIEADKEFIDNTLLASGFFIYRNNERVRNLMKEWWYFVSRYNLDDQLSLPYAIYKSKCQANIIDENFMNNPYLKHWRTK